MRKINPLYIVIPALIIVVLMMVFGRQLNLGLFGDEATEIPEPIADTAETTSTETDQSATDGSAEIVSPTDTPATDVPPTDVPATEVPTEAPTEVPTEAPTVAATEPTDEPAAAETTDNDATETIEEPAPTETAVPSTEITTFDIVDTGFSLAVPTALQVTDVVIRRIPAQSFDSAEPLFYDDVPEYISMTLTTVNGPATLLISPIQDETGTYFESRPDEEVAYFQEFAVRLAEGAQTEITEFQPEYLDIGEDGRALRYVSYQFDTSSIRKVTDNEIYYFIDGITTNGRYYVSLTYPVNTGVFNDTSEFTEEEQTAAQADYEAYLLETLTPLTELPADSFTPSLNLLDLMVESLVVEPDASTQVSPLINDPNCSYFAAFVRDVTINDGQIINPGESFTKIWEVQNNGTCNWTPNYTLQFLDGAVLGWNNNFAFDLVQGGDTTEIALDLVAPQESGIYQGRWQLVTDQGIPFGDILYAVIFVPQEPVVYTPTPPSTVIVPPTSTLVPKECTDELTFITDVSIPDGTAVNPGDSFNKIWEVQNSGTCTWDSSYTIQFSDGTNFGWEGTLPVDTVAPGENFQISVDLVASQETGIYEGRWTLVNDQGQPFGPLVYVTIFVPDEPIAAPTPLP